MRALIGILGAFAMALAAAATAVAAGPAASPNVEATHDTAASRTNVSPVLLRDRSDPTTFYLAEAEMQSAQCRFYVSHDAGATWTQATTPRLPSGYRCDPGSIHPSQYSLSLTQGPDGTLYYAMQPNASDGTHDVFLARSHDGGQSWQVAPVDLVPNADTTTGPVAMDIGPRVAVDPANPSNVYVSFRRTEGVPAGHSGKRVYATGWFASSRDGGATFTTATEITKESVGDFGPAVLVANSTVYTFYPAQGDTSTPIDVAASHDNGKTWTTSVISTAPYADPVSALYDSSRKKFYAAWDDNRDGALDAWFAESSDGVHWSAPHRLNDDPAGAKRGQYFPQLALTPDGRLVAAWYDFRNDPSPVPTPSTGSTALDEGSDLGQWADVYSTTSNDGGASWSTNVRVTDLSIDRTKGTWNAQYFLLSPPALAANQTVAVAAWSDTRLGNAATSAQDIFTGDITLTPAATPITSPIPLWLWLVIGAAAGLTLGAGAALLMASRVMRRQAHAVTSNTPPRPTVGSRSTP